MPAVAIPLAGLTVLATLIGGRVALRLSYTLPTVIALSGGVVVAVTLFEVLPEGIEHVGDPSKATTLVAVGFLAFFFAERVLVLHHRDDPAEAPAGGPLAADRRHCALLGAIVGSFASVSDQTLGYMLCLYAGFFLYMGATDLLPEAHAHASWRKVGLTASGFALVFAITRLAPV